MTLNKTAKISNQSPISARLSESSDDEEYQSLRAFLNQHHKTPAQNSLHAIHKRDANHQLNSGSSPSHISRQSTNWVKKCAGWVGFNNVQNLDRNDNNKSKSF